MLRLMRSVLLSSVATTNLAGAAPSRLPFIADDVARARAEATRSGRPLFVEVWAPW